MRKTPDIDPIQQIIYDYVESLEQRVQQKVNLSSQNQENVFDETPLTEHTPKKNT